MSKDRHPGVQIRIPFDEIADIEIDSQGRRLVIQKKPAESLTPEERRRRVDRWWNVNMQMPFMTKAAVWVNDEAAKIDSAAGGNNEVYGHFMAEDDAGEKLKALLKSTTGRFRDEDLIDRAIRDVRSIELQKNKRRGSFTPFVLDFIDLLGQARSYSPARVERLKREVVTQTA